MPKRKRTEEILSGPQEQHDSSSHFQASEEGNAAGHPGPVEGPITSGSPRATAVTNRVEGVQALDAAAEDLLASHPFWALLISTDNGSHTVGDNRPTLSLGEGPRTGNYLVPVGNGPSPKVGQLYMGRLGTSRLSYGLGLEDG